MGSTTHYGILTGGGGGTFPTANQVLYPTTYGPTGADYEGNVTLPAESQVESGVTYGIGGDESTGSLAVGASLGILKSILTSAWGIGPRDDKALDLGTVLTLTDPSDGTIYTTNLAVNRQYIKQSWASPLWPTPLWPTPLYGKGSYSFGSSYAVGDVVSVGSWWDTMSGVAGIDAMNPFYGTTLAGYIFGGSPSSYNPSSTYAPGQTCQYYDGSSTHYWVASKAISAYQYPSFYSGPWQQIPDAPGVFICIAAHIAPTINYWMWGSTGPTWNLGDKCTDGMYYYQCVLSYTQAPSDSYPSSDSTHWEVLNAYALATVLADTTHWRYFPFMATVPNYAATSSFQLLTYQITCWCQYASTLTFLGYADWHVTSLRELEVLEDPGLSIDGSLFQGITGESGQNILTSTPYGSYHYTQWSANVASQFIAWNGMNNGFGSINTNELAGIAYLCRVKT